MKSFSEFVLESTEDTRTRAEKARDDVLEILRAHREGRKPNVTPYVPSPEPGPTPPKSIPVRRGWRSGYGY
jgi:hypothetical protein